MSASTEIVSSQTPRGSVPPGSRAKPLRVLYSFPHKIGADRICHTAWSQVDGLVKAGADVTVFPGVVHRPLPAGVRVRTTLSWGPLRISYKLFGGLRACRLHDWIVARRLPTIAGEYDVIHTWPLGARRTLQAARRLGIPSFLERPNAHTRFAYEVVREECERIGVLLPPDHEHAYKGEWLKLEEEEYALADALLCPSDFVARTFLDRGFAPERLVRHRYGYDNIRFSPDPKGRDPNRPFTMLFAGGCAPRKGLHYALDAWLKSPACEQGVFVIAGGFVADYREKLASKLTHPSIRALGHYTAMPELMRQADVLVLPTVEEGSALVTYEARASGCVLLVSTAAGAICTHGHDSLVHEPRDVDSLRAHITSLYSDHGRLERLRRQSLSTVKDLSWDAAGQALYNVYLTLVAK